MFRSVAVACVAAVSAMAWPVASPQATSSDRVLSCEAFTFLMKREDLVARYGDAAVKDELLNIGEGRLAPGTTVFSGTRDHLDIFWNERGGPKVLTSVIVRSPETTWSSIDGITIGTDLKAIETINGGPFRLMGLAWDYQGTTMSWAAGKLAAREQERCRLRLRLRPDEAAQALDAYQQVQGTREFTSSHPAMQELNPRVYEMWLEFGRFGG